MAVQVNVSIAGDEGNASRVGIWWGRGNFSLHIVSYFPLSNMFVSNPGWSGKSEGILVWETWDHVECTVGSLSNSGSIAIPVRSYTRPNNLPVACSWCHLRHGYGMMTATMNSPPSHNCLTHHLFRCDLISGSLQWIALEGDTTRKRGKDQGEGNCQQGGVSMW